MYTILFSNGVLSYEALDCLVVIGIVACIGCFAILMHNVNKPHNP